MKFMLEQLSFLFGYWMVNQLMSNDNVVVKQGSILSKEALLTTSQTMMPYSVLLFFGTTMESFTQYLLAYFESGAIVDAINKVVNIKGKVFAFVGKLFVCVHNRYVT